MKTRELHKFINLCNDALFVSIMLDENNMDLIEEFLSIITDTPLSEIKGKVHIKSTRLPAYSKFEAYQNLDLLYEIGDKEKFINIELNNITYKDLLERNIAFGCKVHGSDIKKSASSVMYKSISHFLQVNINNFKSNSSDVLEVKRVGYPGDKALSEKFEIALVDMILANNINSNRKIVKLSKAMTSNSIEEFETNLKGVFSEMAKKKLVNLVKGYNSDEKFIPTYENEPTKVEFAKASIYAEGQESGYAMGKTDGYNLGSDEGYAMGKTDGYNLGNAEGYNRGYNFGSDERASSIADTLFSLGIDKDIIEKATGISKTKTKLI